MRHTIFDTPVVKQVFTLLCSVGLKLRGWKLQGTPPEDQKYILLAAPHTTNWDFIVMLAIAFKLDLKVYWMGKDTIFSPPFGGIMKWLGGVPVNRSKNNNLVDQMADHFDAAERMVLVIPPEGTRSLGKYWKTGFYNIAQKTGVPVCMGFLDYKRKIGGFGPSFLASDDLAANCAKLDDFYKDISGLYPENFRRPIFREMESSDD